MVNESFQISADIESARYLTKEPDEVYELLFTWRKAHLQAEQLESLLSVLEKTAKNASGELKGKIDDLRNIFERSNNVSTKSKPQQKPASPSKTRNRHANDAKHPVYKNAKKCSAQECLQIIDARIRKNDFEAIGTYIERLENLGNDAHAFRKYIDIVTAAYNQVPPETQKALKKDIEGHIPDFMKFYEGSAAKEPHKSRINYALARAFDTFGEYGTAYTYYTAVDKSLLPESARKGYKHMRNDCLAKQGHTVTELVTPAKD